MQMNNDIKLSTPDLCLALDQAGCADNNARQQAELYMQKVSKHHI